MRVKAGSLVPILEPFDEFEGIRPARRLDDLRFARFRSAIADVVADRAVQERGVLRHHADLGPQALLGEPRNVAAIDQDAAALRPVESEQQMHESRFAGAGAADQADPLARCYVEVELAQDAAAARNAAIIEADMLETD